ncbi:MAG: ATP-binding protein [bacterium]
MTLVEGRIASDEDVALARRRALRLAEVLGMPAQEREPLAAVVAAAAAQALRHGGAHIDFFLTWAVREPMLLIEVSDVGPGHADLAATFASLIRADATDERAGAEGLAVLDHVHVTSTPGSGTTLELGRTLQQPAVLSDESLEALAAHTLAEGGGDPGTDAHRRARELRRSLHAMRRRWSEIEQAAGRVALLDRLGEVFGPLQPSDVLLRSAALTIVPAWADACTVILEDWKSDRVHQVTALAPRDGRADASVILAQTPPDGALASELGIDPEPLARADSRLVRAAIDRAGAGEGLDAGPLAEHLAVVPLRDRGQPFGVLGVGRARQPFSGDDQSLIRSIANRLAVSHQNARVLAVLQGATQHRDRILGIVAHELRRPLNALSLDIERLKDSGDDESQARAIHRLDDSVRFMDRLVADLLDVSSFERGLLSMNRRALAVGPLVEEVVASQAQRFHDAGVRLEVSIEAELPEVWGDRHRLEQVLGNLLDNALAHAPRGSTARVQVALARSKRVVLSVTDEGPGIPREEQARVFNAFFRGSTSRRKGMGLGLKIAREIVLGHEGRIWLRSQPGAGAAFHVSLPVGPPRSRSVRDASRRGDASSTDPTRPAEP